MSIQFAGSNSLDNRRRRRLAVNGDGSVAVGMALEDGANGGQVESELVASAAAAPWVPVYEWRIWTYGAIIGLVLMAATFALTRPTAFRPELAPLTNPLLQGSRPVLAVLLQTTFWFLSAQLAILIAWYRSQCKLDFGGRYRVWPWAAAAFGMAAFCSATNAHTFVGEIISRGEWLVWRGEVVSWLLPACVAALPLTLLIDRDVRRSRSSLYALRVAWLFGLGSAWLELFAPQLSPSVWYQPVRMIVPLFGVAVLFLGLWLHARVVAYVCPDPPECDEPGAASQLLTGWRWCAALLLGMIGFVFQKISGSGALATDESEAKSKRRVRKVADGEEAAAPKRKRRATPKRASKPRTRVKVAEDDEEVEAEEESYTDEVDEASDTYDADATETREDEWDEEQEVDATPPTRPNKSTVAPTSTPWSAKNPAGKSWQEEADEDDSGSDEEDEEGDEATYRVDGGTTADQMRGLSKRQKRELRKQLREQQRNQRR